MAVLYRDLKKTYPTIVRGEGVYLYDAEGGYLDAAGGAAVVTIGHGVKEVARGAKAWVGHRVIAAALAEVVAELSHR
jgi:adenosylmethionine-8-amino-7-oxononanoate aminotransferase